MTEKYAITWMESIKRNYKLWNNFIETQFILRHYPELFGGENLHEKPLSFLESKDWWAITWCEEYFQKDMEKIKFDRLSGFQQKDFVEKYFYEVIKSSSDKALEPIIESDHWRLLSTIYPWKFTKTVYRLDDSIAESLITSNVDEVPVQQLSKFPEWSIYVDLSNAKVKSSCGTKNVSGFFATLGEHNSDLNFSIDLVMLLDGDDEFEANSLIFDESTKSISDMIINHAVINRDPVTLHTTLKNITSILLYICQPEPDITNDNENVDLEKLKPDAKKTSKGVKLFEAIKVKRFCVGHKTGEAMRTSLANFHANSSHKTKSPHVRRAHWHGYWTGSKLAGEQTFSYKWVAPSIINGDLVVLKQADNS